MLIYFVLLLGICSSNPLFFILTYRTLKLSLSLLQLGQMLVFQQNASDDYFCEKKALLNF